MAAKEFLVIGLGRFGGGLAATLVGMGHEVLGVDLSGGRLKVDPGGRAMSGKAFTYAESRCNEWTLTCNKN